MKNNPEGNAKQLSNDKSQMAGVLFGAGALLSLYLMLKKSRSLFAWILPVGLMVVGMDLYLKQHQERVSLTGDQIVAQLDELDPITKAEVIKYVTEHEIRKISR